jgi:hypothetical protein
VCASSDRRGHCGVARPRAKHGDARPTDLRQFLTAACSKRENFMGTDQREAVFDTPAETRRERPT